MIIVVFKSGKRRTKANGGVRISLVLAAASCQVGCAPTIRSFTITPQVICAGESAIIRWDASGDTQLTVAPEPPPASMADCAMRGRSTSAYTLIARRNGKDVRSELEVLELQDGGAEPIALSTNAVEGQAVVASGVKNNELWSNRVSIASVAVCDRREIQVKHADRVATLPASGAPSDAFDGMPLAGQWELRSPMSNDEQNYPKMRPKELAILATFRCQKGTP